MRMFGGEEAETRTYVVTVDAIGIPENRREQLRRDLLKAAYRAAVIYAEDGAAVAIRIDDVQALLDDPELP